MWNKAQQCPDPSSAVGKAGRLVSLLGGHLQPIPGCWGSQGWQPRVLETPPFASLFVSCQKFAYIWNENNHLSGVKIQVLSGCSISECSPSICPLEDRTTGRRQKWPGVACHSAGQLPGRPPAAGIRQYARQRLLNRAQQDETNCNFQGWALAPRRGTAWSHFEKSTFEAHSCQAPGKWNAIA